MAGAISGGIFKSTLGLKPALVGGVVGMSIIGTLGVVTNQLRKRNILDIEMRFDD